MMEYLILALLAVIIALLVVLLFNRPKTALLMAHIKQENQALRELLMQQQQLQNESALNLSSTLKDSFHDMEMEIIKNNSEEQLRTQKMISLRLSDIQQANDRRLLDIQNTNDKRLADIQATNDKKLTDIQTTNDKRLAEIQENVNEKLDKSLNERLDTSFRQIGEQLSVLYKSLGELQTLSSGVTDLQKTLSNVKTRGIFGEVQLKNILMDIMDASQYEENIITKTGSSERVEFAVKIPDKENDHFLYLPIDSKFPADIYNRIVDASNQADPEGLKQAVKELEQRIKSEARSIRDKYIDPPNTTDFAILFLPTEGLYAEAIRIAGLTEWCQNECKIVLSGPTTLVALLNSLSIGFRYLSVNKNSKDILHILSAVKTQYAKFGQLIARTQKKLQEAQSAADDLQNRSDIIQKRLSKVEVMDELASSRLLGISEDPEDE